MDIVCREYIGWVYIHQQIPIISGKAQRETLATASKVAGAMITDEQEWHSG